MGLGMGLGRVERLEEARDGVAVVHALDADDTHELLVRVRARDRVRLRVRTRVTG